MKLSIIIVIALVIWQAISAVLSQAAKKQQQPAEGAGDGENPTAKKLKGISDEESSGGVVRDFDDSDNIINKNNKNR